MNPDQIKQTPKIAILVIHGIGQQNPFETLDQFGRGLFEYLGRNEHRLEHHIIDRQNNKEDKWIDSFVRISPANTSEASEALVDIYEYYWANLTEKQITTGEIGDWIDDAIKGGMKALADRPDLAHKSKTKYLRKLLSMVRRINFIYRLLKILSSLAGALGILKPITNLIRPGLNIAAMIKNSIKTVHRQLLRTILAISQFIPPWM